MDYLIKSENPSTVWVSHKLIDEKLDANYMNSKFIKNLDDLYLKLSDSIKIVNNGDIIEELTDFTANGSFSSLSKNVEYADRKGIPFIRIKNMSQIDIVKEDLKYITEDTYMYLKKSKLFEGDVLYSKTGANLGLAMVFPEDFGRASLADNIFKVRYKDSVDNSYVAIFLNCKYGKMWTERFSQGSAQPTIIKENFKKIKIPLPDISTQLQIGNKLRKARILRDQAIKLQGDAENIIDKYLSDNIDMESKYSAHYVNTIDIEERLDSEYYDLKYINVLQKLKNTNYKLKSIKYLCDNNVKNGKTYKVSNSKSKYINVGVGELDNYYVEKNPEKFISENINEKNIMQKYDILWGNAAHLAKYIGEKVNINLDENLYVPTTEITFIRPNIEKINPYYLFLYMKSKWGYHQIQRTVKGMTAHSYPEDISKIVVPIIQFNEDELIKMKMAVEGGYKNIIESDKLMKEAIKDMEALIEGKEY
ncbi:restriction endonuclease subunit S [Paraclostridium bifermentans]|uniref:restriction endonuclease subunit S n=1 Tax=Paraclostridium bifermentans TaxID=1490 RepID=UPI001FF3C173|nr:restriction endonuclease subunit S [Paraclostridium bifermentans]UOW69057.1 restriction endonuclease subunit S [Paraclostridium bifermentans]